MAKKQVKKTIQKPDGALEVPNEKPTLKSPEIKVTDALPLLEKSDRWFRKNMIWVWCLLIFGWVGVRVSCYISIAKSPLYDMYLFNQSDNKFFDDWAKHLNTDWLNAKPFHPFHDWHKEFADYYLEKHPEKLKIILAENTTNDTAFSPQKALWNEWYHGNQYHQEPLYPYLLAVFYHFHLDEVKVMILLQLILGVLSGVLLVLVARRYFGETTAVLTGLLYLLCGILMYNEIILLRTAWLTFLTILLVYVIDNVILNPKPKVFFLCGLCIGLSYLVQSTFSLYLVGVLIIAFIVRGKFVDYVKNACFLLFGFFVMLSPVIIRNKVVGAPAFSISSVGPVTFVSTNVYGVKSGSGWVPVAERDAEIVGKSYNSLSSAIVNTLKTYPSVLSYCDLVWMKIKAIFSGIEYPNNENYYFYQQFIPVLNFAMINFFWIAPMGFAGLLFCIFYRKKFYTLYLAIIVQLITLLTFYVLGRLRTPLVILLLPLTAFAMIECINVWHKKRAIIIAEIGTVVVLLILSFSGYSATMNDEIIYVGNYRIVYDLYFNDKLDNYAKDRQWDKWLALQEQFIDMEPEYIKNLSEGETVTNINRVNIAQVFLEKHIDRKKIYDIIGDKANASNENNIITALNTFASNSLKELNVSASKSSFESLYNLAGTYIDQRKYAEAIGLLHKLLDMKPDDEKAQMRIGAAFYVSGQYDSSEVHDKIAMRINPQNIYAINNLAGVYLFRQRYAEAIALYNNVIKLKPDYVDPYTNIAACYLNTGKIDSGMHYLYEAISVDPNNNRAYEFLARVYKSIGKQDSSTKYESIAQKNNPAFKL